MLKIPNGSFPIPGGYYSSRKSANGFPDVLAIAPVGSLNAIIACEVKKMDGKPSKLQIAYIDELNARGVVSKIIYSKEEFLDWFTYEICKGGPVCNV